ncbi:hypothetical protein [Microbulbifer halophilus]|uniref:Right handed beta helix domain-containing protein n=1 Tax=Microbulbifer halophilus TaxID=453963 RepID=A0ABW5EG67_9GAMM|nr:hypothetical protein [Microbulbifer halophilus]MCW8126313.1 hypothetical protein [Microbulbifer halophilus]
MNKIIATVGLLALASASQAVTTLGGDAECNSNGESQGFIPFNGTAYLGCELPISIAVDDTVVLAKDSATLGLPIVWTLPGIVEVGNGSGASATPSSVDHTLLQIEAGAQIAGAVDSNSGLLISRGAGIEAVGTAGEPIVFSSLDDNYSESGEWGGLVIAGFGQSNDCPNDTGSCEMEGVAAGHYFGGGLTDNESPNSTLEYVVIAEGGHVIEDGNEINGLTLYAADDDKVAIDNVHVHNNADDGIEFFGGDAEVNNLWLTCNEDDSVDWDTGFHGSIENLSILQGGAGDSNTDSAGYAFELAGNPNDPTNQPQSNGSVTNASITLVSGAVQTDEVFRLKEGTLGSFTNIDISGYAGVGCDDIDANSSGSFSSLAYDCNPTDLPAETSATGFTEASFWSAPACD